MELAAKEEGNSCFLCWMRRKKREVLMLGEPERKASLSS
jgi:hypothetical protein